MTSYISPKWKFIALAKGGKCTLEFRFKNKSVEEFVID